jgi:PKD repeat protein
MRYLFIVAFGLLSGQVTAQITINQSHMPVSGDTIRYSNSSPIGLSFDSKKKGANQSWDFSGLQSTGQGLYEYLSANKTPYLFYFFNQIGLKTADSIGVSQFSFKNIYSFYTKSSTVFKAEGLGYSVAGIPLAASYKDEDEIYQFPLNFGDSDVTSFHFEFSIPGQPTYAYIQAGKRINIVDGWGSLKTPYKNYSSVLRVKTVMDEVDTFVTQFGKIPIPRRQVIYKWLSTSEKIPVLEITGTEINNTFTATQVRYRDSIKGQVIVQKPVARFDLDKTTGYVNADTFTLTDMSSPVATGFSWQITPSADVVYVNGTTASSKNPRVVFTQRGAYSVSLTASNSAGSDDTSAADVIEISYGLGTQGVSQSGIFLYPNPAVNAVWVKGAAASESYVVYALNGEKVLEGLTLEGGRIALDGVISGAYVLKVAGTMVPFHIAH